MNELYRNHVVTSVKNMLIQSEDAEKCPHEGVKGRLREIFIDELLQPYLHPSIKICTGIIIDSNNSKSNQIDIIIYDAELIPPALLKKETGYIPYESVLATIEVKSTLTSATLTESLNNALSVRELAFSRSFVAGYGGKEKIIYPIHSVFAFDTDLTGKRKSELARLDEKLKGYDFRPISSLCIARKVLLLFGNLVAGQNNGSNNEKWLELVPQQEFDEVLIFLGATIDTCNIIKRVRKSSFIQEYFIEERIYKVLRKQ